MNFKILLFVFAISTQFFEITSQSIACRYDVRRTYAYIYNYTHYSCEVQIDDWRDFESFSSIEEGHEDEKTDDDVKYLELIADHSKLKEFSSLFCDTFQNLEIMKIEKLKIKSIDDDSLQKCEILKRLVFTMNDIQYFPENFLSENAKLIDFEFSFNKIKSIDEDAFEMLENLQILNLKNNKLKKLPDGIFRALSNLEQLYLDENTELDELNPNWFKGLKNIIRLSLNHNNIQYLPVDVFKDLHNLTMLEMNQNFLREIHAVSFGNRGSLSAVFLNENNIDSIDPKFIQDSAISMLHMVGNHCFAGITNARDHTLDQSLQRCYKRHKDLTTTTSTTTTTTPSTTTTTTTTPSTTTTTTIPTTTTTTPTTTTTTPTTTTTKPTTTLPTTTQPITTTTQPFSRQIWTRATTIPTTFPKTISTTTIEPTTTESPPIIWPTPPPMGLCGILHDKVKAKDGEKKFIRGSYPWAVAIMRSNGQFVCSGVLVTSQKVVTAARCMYKVEKKKSTEMLPRDILVVLGSHNIYQLFEIGKTNMAVQTIHRHKDFNPKATQIDGDIAVVVLDNSAHPGAFINTICLINASDDPLSVNDGIVVSYGHNETMSFNPEVSPTKFEMPIQDELTCIFSNDAFAYISSNRTLCAGTGKGEGVCSADYGSGLYVKSNGRIYLRGILSAVISNDSKKKCSGDSYSLFTDVASYSKWIEDLPLEEIEDEEEEEDEKLSDRFNLLPVWT